MKKILLFLSAFIVASSLFAQAPQGINYQGVARNNVGAAISKTNIGVQFTILQGGVTKYQENQTVQTDTFGLYSLVIGNGIVTSGSFASIPWSSGNLSIQVGIDPLGGSSYNTVANTLLQSVPYALYAGSAGTSSGSITSVTGTSPITVSPITAGTVTVGLGPVGPTVNTYGTTNAFPIISVDADGRITGATTQSFSAVTQVNTGTGIDGGPITGVGTLSLSPSGVVAGNYGNANSYPTFTVDVLGRITNAATSTQTLVTSIAGTGPITTTVFASGAVSVGTSTTITAGAVGSATDIPVITYDQYGRITAVTSQAISGSLPTPTVGSLLYSNSSNSWTPTNPSNISSDGSSITVINTTTVGTAATFSTNGAGNNAPALQVTSNSSTGYAIRADNLSGAAIVANSNGPYAIEGNIAAGAGDAVIGEIENGANGNAINGYIDPNSTGHAGYFTYNNTTAAGTDTVLEVINKGNGYSGSFNGGKGLQTDRIKISGTAAAPPAAGYVLTSDALGNGTWQAASTGSGWLTSGNSAGSSDFIGTTNAQPLIFKTNGSEAMRIDNVSNWLGVGTGNASLISQLDVNGNIHLNTGKILTGPVGGINDGYTGIYGGDASGDLILSVFKNGASGGSLGSVNSYDAMIVQGNTGNVGIGTNTPAAVLEVDGPSGGGPTLKIVDGNQAFGKVLTSDGSGNATWQISAAQTLSLAGNTLSISGGNSVTLPPPPVSGASNGLSVTTGSIELGGTLTNNTTISQSTFPMIFNGTTGNVQINNSSASTALTLANTSTGNAMNITANGGTGINITTGTGYAINASSAGGSGQATINSTNTGSISASGAFTINNPGNINNALSAITNGGGNAISANNTGSGQAGAFSVGAGNSSPVLSAFTSGGGNAGIFQISNTGNSNAAINAMSNGTGGNAINATSSGGNPTVWSINSGTTGSAGSFQVNAGNNSNALNASTAGSGAAINAINSYTTGSAGSFATTNTSSNANALNVSSSGTGNTIVGVNLGIGGNAASFINNSSSNGAAALNAVTQGTSNAGFFQISNTFNTIPALVATTNGSGAAFNANNTGTGPAITASTPTGSSATVIQAIATSGYSGKFTGGLGLQTDNFTMTNTDGIPGSVMMSTNTTGGAAWAGPVNFSGSGSTTTTIPSASVTPITFASTDYSSPVAAFNGTVFSAPVAGVYHIDVVVTFSATAAIATNTSYQLQIDNVPAGTLKTSIIPIPTGSIAGTLFQNRINTDIQLAAGEQIQVGAYINPSTSLSVLNQAPYTYFTGHVIH